jgi:hypothetical protein
VIGDPFALGNIQVTTILLPLLTIVGANGCAGLNATNNVIMLDYCENPNTFLDCTVNLYVRPGINPVTVYEVNVIPDCNTMKEPPVALS